MTSLRVERVGVADAGLMFALDRPAVRNAIDDALLGRLLDAVDGVAGDGSVRFLVVTGTGGVFSAGMDLRERSGFDDDALMAQRARIVRLITAVHALPIPVVAAVEGPAMAGGFELALACDLIVAGEGAVFALPETGVGIFPGGGATQALSWLVGPARARDLILTGRRLTAAEAEAWGIVARVVPTGTALETGVDLAASIAARAPIGVREAKAGIRAAHRALAEAMVEEDARYERVVRSADRHEGFRAFVEKRPPRFEGR